MKVVINACYGGFGLSGEAMVFLKQPLPENEALLKLECYNAEEYDHKSDWVNGELVYDWTPRTHPKLIECIEKLGSERASGRFAELKIVEIPDDVDWVICEYDGNEWVAEKHRTWC